MIELIERKSRNYWDNQFNSQLSNKDFLNNLEQNSPESITPSDEIFKQDGQHYNYVNNKYVF